MFIGIACPGVQRNLEWTAVRQARNETANRRDSGRAMGVREFWRSVIICARTACDWKGHTQVLYHVTGDLELLEGDSAIPRKQEHIPVLVSHDDERK